MSQPYQYIDSGIEWIGEIPDHWSFEKLKNHFEVTPSNVDKKVNEGEELVSLCNYVDVYKNDFIDTSINFMEASANLNEIEKFQIFLEDVIITKDSEDPYDIAVPALVVETKEKLLCGYHLSLLRSLNNKITGKYLFWALKDEFMATQLWREATGITRWAIASKHIKNSIIPYPPKPEQTAIADYLDKVCAEIDAIIKLKTSQKELVQQAIFSFIDEIFSKGETNSSPWINERLKDIAFINPSIVEKLSDSDLVTYIPMEAVSENGDIDNSLKKPISDLINGLNYFRNGDVILAKITPCMENGKGAYVKNLETQIALGSTEFFVLRPSGKVIGEYIYYYTWSAMFRKDAEANMKGAAGQQRVTAKYIKSARIKFPSSQEQQQQIVSKISTFKNKSKQAIENLNAQIEIISSFKKSFIHEVVTGKKQVVGFT